MIGQDIFSSIFIIPVVNVLVAFYHVFLLLHVPGAFGWAILALTTAVRLAMHPLFMQQIHTQKKMTDLKPHLDHISRKHKEDPQKLQQEQMRIYKEAGLNPASGCLLLIVQMPVFIGLYNSLSRLLSHGSGADVVANINKVLYAPWLQITSIDPMFLGFNLALSPQRAGIWYYYLIPLLTAALQYGQTVMTMQMNQPVTAKADEKNDDKKDSMSGDFQKALNTQMRYIFPIMIGWFAYSLPVGMSLYWNVFSVFSIIQYRQLKNNTMPAIETVIEEGALDVAQMRASTTKKKKSGKKKS